MGVFLAGLLLQGRRGRRRRHRRGVVNAAGAVVAGVGGKTRKVRHGDDGERSVEPSRGWNSAPSRLELHRWKPGRGEREEMS